MPLRHFAQKKGAVLRSAVVIEPGTALLTEILLHGFEHLVPVAGHLGEGLLQVRAFLVGRILDVVVVAARWGAAFQHVLETVNELRHLKFPNVFVEYDGMATSKRPHVLGKVGGLREACPVYEDGDDTYGPA